MSSNREPIKNFKGKSSLTVPVLHFLYGLPFSEYVEAFFEGMGATCYRIIPHNSGVKMDCDYGRITVYLDDNQNIDKIELGIDVGLPDGIEDGHELYCKILELTGKDELV